MEYVYAQLDENNICCGVSYLCGEISAPNTVRLDEAQKGQLLDSGLLGKRYENGQFIEVK